MRGQNKLVAVVGGGAAGLVAAIAARRKGARVMILERLDRVGKKILATGNGRCNLTNQNLDISHYFGQNPKFVHSALHSFDYGETLAFFEALGITCKVEEGGKVFPVSDQASSVLDVLREEVDRLGIAVYCQEEVTDIVPQKGGFTLFLAGGKKRTAQRVILATGGRAAPNLGSNGSGYKLAEKLGHSIVPPFPALVQLKLDAPFLKQIKGVKFVGQAFLLQRERVLEQAEGEILFTEYGVSGPPILSLSRRAGQCLGQQEEVCLRLCLIPWQTPEELRAYLSRRFTQQARKTVSFGFVGFLHKRLIPVVLREAGVVDLHKPMQSITKEERKGIGRILQDWRFSIKGAHSWQQAQVTAGGVDVREVDQRTMASKKVLGLFFAGELLDVDGACGGYNLQWAWSSGYIAGEQSVL